MTRGIRIVAGLAFGACLAWSSTSFATQVGRSRTFGLGFQLGDPTAIVGKAFVGGGTAFDFGLGFEGYGYGYGWCRDGRGHLYRCGRDYFGANDLSVHGDFIWQDNLTRSQVDLDWHIGGGARIIFFDAFGDGKNDFILIGRMPVGLDLMFPRPDFIEVFFEIAPGLRILPPLGFTVDAAIGARFYF